MKTIKTNREYQKALKLLEKLMCIVGKYEEKEFPSSLPDPIEAIKFRMQQQGLRQKDLIPYLGFKSRVSEILSGKRRLTVAMIRGLHYGLGIPLKSLIGEKK